jgi:PAS domain S-box-containing protein
MASQREIEIILARSLAEHLAMSIFIVDPEGNLLFYNESAEDILGYRFDETGPMPAAEWSTVFDPFDQDGNPLKPDDLPLIITLSKQTPQHKAFWIKSMDGVLRKIAVTSIPLIGHDQRFIGAVAIFWEVEE